MAKNDKNKEAATSTTTIEKLGMMLEAVKDVVRDEIGKLDISARELTIKSETPIHVEKSAGIRHSYQDLVTALVAIKSVNLGLIGEAGSGKNKLVEIACSELAADFVIIACSKTDSESKLFGYMDATGNFVSTAFIDAFQTGKVVILDEMDSASPELLTCINNSIANRIITLPNRETVKAHDNFRAVAIMNTNGLGADGRYTGRDQLDRATLDRFCLLEIPHDWAMTANLCGISAKVEQVAVFDGGELSSTDIYVMVTKAKKWIDDKRIDAMITPRSLIYATELARHGIGKKWVQEMALFNKGLSDSNKAELQAHLN